MNKLINGWTKERLIEVVKSRRFPELAVDNLGTCVYLASNGNKCAVGLFIPNGHPAQKSLRAIKPLLDQYPELVDLMPLQDMDAFQKIHDNSSRLYNDHYGNATKALLDYIEREVE